jgi:hypothetical protein
MQYLQDKCKKVNVRINSAGGNVLDGYSIISSMINSTIPVDVYIDGLAASISAIIAMCGQKVCMMDYGTLMIHNPEGADQDILDLIKNTLVTILSNRTQYSATEISKMMDDETFFNAKECLKNGMCDEIITSKSKIKVTKGESIANLAIIYNKLIQNNNNEMENKEQEQEQVTEVTEVVNEVAESIETEVINEVAEPIETEVINETVIASIIDERDIRIKELEDKIAEFIKEKKYATDKKINEMVNSFVKSGKIKAEEIESITKLANIDFDGVKNMLDKIGGNKAIKIMDTIKFEVSNEKSEWTIRDWEKKDPEGLLLIKDNNPEMYEIMYNKFYKK